MTVARPELMTFGTSHYCEKARWALDWHRLPYREIVWPPGLHQILAKRCGASCGSLPMLRTGAGIVQGSGEIIDWAEARNTDSARSLAPGGDIAEAREIERRANDILAVHARRLAFAETLPAHAHLLKPAMFKGVSPWQRLVGTLMWPGSRRIMMRVYDAGPAAAAESRAILEAELGWLDAKLADGRRYLAGARFSRVDLTVASLLAPLARPAEMPIFHLMQAPEALSRDIIRWRDRPVMRFVRRQYRQHRAGSQ